MASNELLTVAVNENSPGSLHHCLSPDCNKGFKSASRLNEHIQRKHTKPMSCGFPHCEYRSGSLSSMKRHRLRWQHPESNVPPINHLAPEATAAPSPSSPFSTFLSVPSPSFPPSSTSLSPTSTSLPPPSSSTPSTIPPTIYSVAETRPGFGYPTFTQDLAAGPISLGRISTDHSQPSQLIDLTTEDTIHLQPSPLIDLTTEGTIDNQLGGGCRRNTVWDYCDCALCDPFL